MRFVLIHGGFHGAWCWGRLIPEIERLGHTAIAIDLPGHGERRGERSTLANRREAIAGILQPEDILVGHSGGGFDITLAADAAPELVSHLIYLAATLPLEGRTLLETNGVEPTQASGSEAKVTRLMADDAGVHQIFACNAAGQFECPDIKGVREFFYHDCDDETVAWAFARLTPQPAEYLAETVSVPRFWKAELPRSFIYCLQDRSAPYALCRTVAERLGVIPLAIDTSHSPFLSRPSELARLLVHASLTAPIKPLRPD